MDSGFSTHLRSLKQTGGQLLVCGDCPPAVFTPIITRLLGFADRGRSRVLTLFATNPENAHQYVRNAGPDAGHPHIILPAHAHRTATATTTRPGDYHLHRPADSLDDIHHTTTRAIERLASDRSTPFEPGDLRYHLDSLPSVIDAYGREAALAFARDIRACVRARNGLGHFVLPAPKDSDTVTAFEATVDATLELRLADDTLEQRWHLHEPAISSGWLSVQ